MNISSEGGDTFRPLLRWAGSKRQFLPQLVAQAPPIFHTYVEPFAGSASLYFALRPSSAVVGDVNSGLINFYCQLRERPKDLHSLTCSLKQDLRTYLLSRARFNVECEPLERAALFWYLNRTCFNGLYRTNRAGEFNVPMGRKLADFPSVSDAFIASTIMRSAVLVLGDFEETIDLADRDDFLYVDPPYHRVSKRDRGEYGPQAMKDCELGRLVESVLSASDRGVKVLFSYNVDLAEVLQGWRKILVRGRYVIGANAHGRHRISEYIYCNY